MLLAAAPAIGAEPIVWKWAVGDAPRYQMTQSMKMSMNAGPAGEVQGAMRQDVLMTWKVESVEPDGVTTMQQQTDRIVMENKGPGGQSFKYDSDSDEPPAGMAALVAPMFDAMVEHPFELTMKPNGEITDIKLSEELSAAFDKLPGGAVTGDMVAQMSKQSMLTFPAEPLAVGESWTTTAEVNVPALGPMKVLSTYTYDGTREVEGHEYEAFTPSIKIEVTPGEQKIAAEFESKDSTGEILFDRETGRIFRSRVLQTMEVRMKIGDQELVNVVDQAIEMRELGPDEDPQLGDPEAAQAAPTEEPATTE